MYCCFLLFYYICIKVKQMKKIFLFSIFIIVSANFVFGQQETKLAATTPQFTKAELLAFDNVKALLSAIDKGKDYSINLVRNFNLTTTVTNADKTTTKLSESGPGGQWSEKQKTMIEKYAKKETIFTLENIILIESGKKGTINQPNISFSIKE